MAKLKEEIRQAKAFATVREEAYLALQRTSDLVSRPVERIFSRWKLTPEQYNVLRILRGSEPKGLPTLEIGRRMVTRASNVTRIIDRLEAKGYALRKRDKRDRRVVQIRISSSGLKLLGAMSSDVDGAVKISLQGLTDAESRRILALLEKLRNGLDRARRRPARFVS